MTPEQKAQNTVDGFFIGGGGDTLEQPGLTKFDLKVAISAAITDERERCEKEAVAPILITDNDPDWEAFLQQATQTHGAAGFRAVGNGVVRFVQDSIRERIAHPLVKVVSKHQGGSDGK